MNLDEIQVAKTKAIECISDAFDELEAVCRTLNDATTEVATAKPEASDAEATPTPPAAEEPEVTEWVETAKMVESGQTIQTYLDAKWSYERMAADGLVEKKVASAPAPPPPADEPKYKMTALASGSSYQNFIDKGWEPDQIVKAGYVEVQETAAPAPAIQKFPWQDSDGNWIDKAGIVHDPDQHACGSNGSAPPLKVDGTFKKSKKRPATAVVEAAPALADSTPPPPAPSDDTPTPPAADITPPPPVAEETNPDLEKIMSEFNSDGGPVV